jgi:aryl sulfotransferase
MPRGDVIIAGFPKSGNTWLSRLMGDVLNRPIRGIGNAVPLAAEGEERGAGRGIIQQLHLIPDEDIDEEHNPGFIASQWRINPRQYNGEHVIHIIRDPRDVAVSIDAYWGRFNIDVTLCGLMAKGEHPLWGTSWRKYIEAWRDTTQSHVESRYEWLHADPAKEMQRLLNLFGLKPEHDLGEVIERQSFLARKEQIERDGENMPHGKGIQRANMRKGIVGDWRNVFTAEQKRMAFQLFNDHILALGYETNPLWWCDYQEHDERGLLEMLNALYTMTDTGEELCRTLYRLSDNVTGDIVEVGAGRGRTAIALGWRSGNHVKSVDDYADHLDWANNIYDAQARSDYLLNTRKAGVQSIPVYRDSWAAAVQQNSPIGLWFWDISSAGRLLKDWQIWRDRIRGRALIRDTFDQRLGSRDVLEYENGRGEFEIERDDPGVLILRRIT